MQYVESMMKDMMSNSMHECENLVTKKSIIQHYGLFRMTLIPPLMRFRCKLNQLLYTVVSSWTTIGWSLRD